MMIKVILSVTATALTLLAFWPYIQSIRRGHTKPHVFSWVIWGSTTFIVFLAQLADRGGAGAWPIGVSGVITLYIALLAYRRRADSSITGMDWWFFLAAMTALPFWYFTADPLWAVVILTAIDVLGFGPTFRKAYYHPFDETLVFFVLITVRNLIALLALEHYSLTTVLFPAVLALACTVFIAMVMWQRHTQRL